jgi:hypothetical protein
MGQNEVALDLAGTKSDFVVHPNLQHNRQKTKNIMGSKTC